MRAHNELRLESIRQRTDMLGMWLTAIHNYYYSSHPATGEFGATVRLNAIMIALVPDTDWSTINAMMGDYIATMRYDRILTMARKAITHLRLQQSLIFANAAPVFSIFSWIRPTINAVKAEEIVEIEERLRVVEGWLNTLEHQLMPSFWTRVGVAIGWLKEIFKLRSFAKNETLKC